MNNIKEKKFNPPMPSTSIEVFACIPKSLVDQEFYSRWWLSELLLSVVRCPYNIELRDLRRVLTLQPKLAQQLEKVLEFGARKYEPLNFRKVPRLEYIGAMLRHLRAEEECDAESGLPHSAHVLANIMILVDRYILTGEYGTEGYEGGIL